MVTSLQRGPHSILTDKLLANYGPTTARSVMDPTTATEVRISLIFQQVIDLVSCVCFIPSIYQAIDLIMQWGFWVKSFISKPKFHKLPNQY